MRLLLLSFTLLVLSLSGVAFAQDGATPTPSPPVPTPTPSPTPTFNGGGGVWDWFNTIGTLVATHQFTPTPTLVATDPIGHCPDGGYNLLTPASIRWRLTCEPCITSVPSPTSVYFTPSPPTATPSVTLTPSVTFTPSVTPTPSPTSLPAVLGWDFDGVVYQDTSPQVGTVAISQISSCTVRVRWNVPAQNWADNNFKWVGFSLPNSVQDIVLDMIPVSGYGVPFREWVECDNPPDWAYWWPFVVVNETWHDYVPDETLLVDGHYRYVYNLHDNQPVELGYASKGGGNSIRVCSPTTWGNGSGGVFEWDMTIVEANGLPCAASAGTPTPTPTLTLTPTLTPTPAPTSSQFGYCSVPSLDETDELPFDVASFHIGATECYTVVPSLDVDLGLDDFTILGWHFHVPDWVKGLEFHLRGVKLCVQWVDWAGITILGIKIPLSLMLSPLVFVMLRVLLRM